MIDAPRGGYLVHAAQAALVAEKLRLHGIAFDTIATAGEYPVQSFRADKATFAARSNEGHQNLEIAGQWRDETRSVPAGSLFVPIAQARSRLVMAMLEPQAPDSLLQWGVFNTAFERKEYMEDYVAEDVARDMLEPRPGSEGAIRAASGQRCRFRRRPEGKAGILRPPAFLLGRALPLVSGVAHGTDAVLMPRPIAATPDSARTRAIRTWALRCPP